MGFDLRIFEDSQLQKDYIEWLVEQRWVNIQAHFNKLWEYYANQIYDRKIEIGSRGELRICDHIEKKCTCGGFPPYQTFNLKGEYSWCPCRSARIKLISTKKAFKESQIPKKYLWKFIDDFKIVSDKAEKIIGFVSTIPLKSTDQIWKQGFYFWGPAGSGKTLLSSIVLQELMLKYGSGGRFVDLSRQFFQRLRSSYSISDESYGETGQILDELIEIPFLVIDDFGVQRNTVWEMEMLYNLIDSRYTEERPTIITSNISIDKFKTGTIDKSKNISKDANIDKPLSIAHDRIHSRIQEMCKIIYFDLPDYRKKYMQSIEL